MLVVAAAGSLLATHPQVSPTCQQMSSRLAGEGAQEKCQQQQALQASSQKWQQQSLMHHENFSLEKLVDCLWIQTYMCC